MLSTELKIGQVYSHSNFGRIQLAYMDEKICYFVNKNKQQIGFPTVIVQKYFKLSRSQKPLFKKLIN